MAADIEYIKDLANEARDMLLSEETVEGVIVIVATSGKTVTSISQAKPSDHNEMLTNAIYLTKKIHLSDD